MLNQWRGHWEEWMSFSWYKHRFPGCHLPGQWNNTTAFRHASVQWVPIVSKGGVFTDTASMVSGLDCCEHSTTLKWPSTLIIKSSATRQFSRKIPYLDLGCEAIPGSAQWTIQDAGDWTWINLCKTNLDIKINIKEDTIYRFFFRNLSFQQERPTFPNPNSAINLCIHRLQILSS